MKIILLRMFSLIFFLQVVSPPLLAAQLGLQAPDIEPPAILFDAGSAEIEEGIKTFTATVTDNVGVASVTLYYKGVTDVAFKPREMKQSSTDPNVYSAKISLDAVISDKIEIYIRADDVSGNSIFEGQKFSPLAYTIVPADAGKVITPVTEPPADEEEEGMSTLTMILIGLGVAALAGGGGSSDSPPPPPGGSVIISVTLP